MSELIYLYRVLYIYWSIAFFKQIVDIDSIHLNDLEISKYKRESKAEKKVLIVKYKMKTLL
jgi:hypothetical protein